MTSEQSTVLRAAVYTTQINHQEGRTMEFIDYWYYQAVPSSAFSIGDQGMGQEVEGKMLCDRRLQGIYV